MTFEQAMTEAETLVGKSFLDMQTGQMCEVDQIDYLCGPRTRVVLAVRGDPAKTIWRSLAEVRTGRKWLTIEAAIEAATDDELVAAFPTKEAYIRTK